MYTLKFLLEIHNQWYIVFSGKRKQCLFTTFKNVPELWLNDILKFEGKKNTTLKTKFHIMTKDKISINQNIVLKNFLLVGPEKSLHRRKAITTKWLLTKNASK